MRKSLEPVLDRVFGDLSAWRIKERWSGVGGTITSLAAGMQDLSEYVREAVNGYAIRRELLQGMLEKLDRMGEKGRERHPVFSPRKDTILPGGVILQYLMDRLDLDAIIASDMDGLEGYAISVLFPEGKPERIRFLMDF